MDPQVMSFVGRDGTIYTDYCRPVGNPMERYVGMIGEIAATLDLFKSKTPTAL